MENAQWRDVIKNYNKPINWKSHWQIINTFGLYLLSWPLAYYAYEISPWLCLAVAAIAQIFYGRLFIIMHDCGHGSFYKSAKARTFWGYMSGIAWLTPYHLWSKAHAIHHRTSGNLDKRGIGDIWTLTVDEYQRANFWGRLKYRIYRNPLVTLFGGSLLVFFIQHRFSTHFASKKDRRSVYITNIAIVIMAIAIASVTSWSFYLFYQFFLLLFGGILGVLFFFVQHQYEDVYWAKTSEWKYEQAALEGSSFLKLPRLLTWASGNIGFHHIHHLSHTIPNYRLETAMLENKIFQKPTTLGLVDLWRCMGLKLFDQTEKRMISFKEFNLREKRSAASLEGEGFGLKKAGNSLG